MANHEKKCFHNKQYNTFLCKDFKSVRNNTVIKMAQGHKQVALNHLQFFLVFALVN